MSEDTSQRSETKEELVVQLVTHVDQTLRNHVAAIEFSHVNMQKVYDLPMVREVDRRMLPVLWQIYEGMSEKIQDMMAKTQVARLAVTGAVSPEQVASLDEAIELVQAKDKAIRELRKMIEVRHDV